MFGETVQDQVIIQEIPEVQVVERIQEQTMDPKVVPEERVQQHIVEQIVDVTMRAGSCPEHSRSVRRVVCMATKRRRAVTSSKLFVDGWSECFAEKLPRSTKRVS